MGAFVFAPRFLLRRLGLDARPARVVAPTVAGTPTVGHVLRCTSGVRTKSGHVSTGYQWQRDNAGGGSYSDIRGATSNTHRLGRADKRCNIRCNVTDTDSRGSATVASDTVFCASSVSVTWDPTVRQKWEPDTLFLLDADHERTFFDPTHEGLISLDHIYAGQANPFLDGNWSVVSGKYRKGLARTTATRTDGVWMPAGGLMLPPDEFTVEFFLRCSVNWASTKHPLYLFSLGSEDANFAVVIQAGGGVEVRAGHYQSGIVGFVASAGETGAYVANQWYSIAFVYSGGSLKLYLEGSLLSTWSLTPPKKWGSTSGKNGLVMLGSDDGTPWRISDLRISRKARTPGVPVTVSSLSTVTVRDTVRGDTINANLRGGFKFISEASYYGTAGQDVEEALVAGIYTGFGAIGKFLESSPIKAGAPDATHPSAGQSGLYSYDWQVVDRDLAYYRRIGAGWTQMGLSGNPQITGGAYPPYSGTDLLTKPAGLHEFGVGPPNNYTAYARLAADLVHHVVVEENFPATYWALWNEPDGPVFWSGTIQQYIDLYIAVAPVVRAAVPGVKIGCLDGYAWWNSQGVHGRGQIIYDIISACVAAGVTIDFFSIHYPASTVEYETFRTIVDNARSVCGYSGNIEVLVSENAVTWLWAPGTGVQPFNAAGINYSLNDWGAAWLAVSMMEMQRLGYKFNVEFKWSAEDGASFEDGVGMISHDFEHPWAQLNVYDMWGRMAPTVITADYHNTDPGIWCVASRAIGRATTVMVANLSYRKDKTVDLRLALPPRLEGATTVHYVIDDKHSNYYDQVRNGALGRSRGALQSFVKGTVSGNALTISMRPRSVHLLEFTEVT